MKDIPGVSDSLPAKRDAFADPITAHRGLWVDAPGDVVDSELRRMGDTPKPDGKVLGPPAARFKGGIDLRDVTTVDVQNAYGKYQELARQPGPGTPPIKDVVARIMQTQSYRDAPDGDPGTKGTKLAMVANPMRLYREKADKGDDGRQERA